MRGPCGVGSDTQGVSEEVRVQPWCALRVPNASCVALMVTHVVQESLPYFLSQVQCSCQY